MAWQDKKRRVHPLRRHHSNTSVFKFSVKDNADSEAFVVPPSTPEYDSPEFTDISMDVPSTTPRSYANPVAVVPTKQYADTAGKAMERSAGVIERITEERGASGDEDVSSDEERMLQSGIDAAGTAHDVGGLRPSTGRIASSSGRPDLIRMKSNPGDSADDGDDDPLTSTVAGTLPWLHSEERLITAFWRQTAQRSITNKKALSGHELKKYMDSIINNTEVDNKEKIKQEIHFISSHFCQRRCTRFVADTSSFYSRIVRVLKKKDIHLGSNREFCCCGLEKLHHNEKALEVNIHNTKAWSTRDTEPIFPWNFGNLDVPGHYNYLETPGGTKKYIRLDDIRTEPKALWELLTHYWGLTQPNLVISVTGGDVSSLLENLPLYKKFKDGFMRCAVRTKAWILTDGMQVGSAKEIGEMFQEDLRRSEYAEVDAHANIPLIGFAPWGILADRHQLQGIHVGSDEASYYYSTMKKGTTTYDSPNALDPYHVVYVFTDDGTSGRYTAEPKLRSNFEKYIKTNTSLELLGTKDVKTPLVIVVMGGDKFTIPKVAKATYEHTQISVVIVSGSGVIADMLATIYKALEYKKPRSHTKEYGWSDEEDKLFHEYAQSYKNLLSTKDLVDQLKRFMRARHLIEVFGTGNMETRNLDRAILTAIFGGITDISVQLFLALAMDRYDIAKENIFIESRKEEIREQSEMIQKALMIALRSGRSKFVELLLDQDYGGKLNEFDKFLTVDRLHMLHTQNLDPGHLMGKVLRSLCKRNVYGDHMLDRHQLLPQVGRILYMLLGDHYRLLYQEMEFRTVTESPLPCRISTQSKEEAVWHLFIWALLANKPKVAELFLYETSCKIGAALLAYKVYIRLSDVASGLAEIELVGELKANAEYFQSLAVQTLENLYEFDRDEAYASLVAIMPVRIGKYMSPLALADDAAAMEFISHACCQTFLNLVWMKYMDLDTPKWKLFPIWALLPFINVSFIVFDKRNLSFGSFKQTFIVEEEQEKVERVRLTSETASSVSLDKDESVGSAENMTLPIPDVVRSKYNAENKHKAFKRMRFAWFCVKSYYSSPVMKFTLYMTSYMILLGIFTHFLLSKLRPIDDVSDISVYEWLVMVWVFCVSVEEITQLFGRTSSGPLYDVAWWELEPDWSDTWYWHERLFFVSRFYKIWLWLSDRWNKIDALMMVCFIVSVVLRFTLKPIDFGMVRIMYSVTLMIFYFRLLRIGYILEEIGPRIVTIKAMLKDLFQFFLILAVFIISFGVAFQAILDPSKPPSWDLVVDVIWRPYWQMYGELFIEDAADGMGRESVNRTCTYDRSLANEDPSLEYCYNWMAVIFLGVYMLITNILLLNLLIAIFSHSFELIEAKAQTIWRYHLYDLVHEYYYQVWLPPPLNILCHLANLILWVIKWPRTWAYYYAVNRCKKRITDRGKEAGESYSARFWSSSKGERLIETELKQDSFYWFYFTVKGELGEEINHFVQYDYMRDEDLEEKAYKRYLRNKEKQKEDKLKKMLSDNNSKLQNISTDIIDIKLAAKQQGNGHVLHKAASSIMKKQSKLSTTSLHGAASQSLNTYQVESRLDTMDSKINGMQRDLTALKRDIATVLRHIKN